ncbi:MAG: multidrug efflux SMR transporter [Anaerolineae bacterium]
MSPFAYLMVAIVSEVIATSSLRLSDGFSKLVPSIVVVFGYVIAFYMLSQALKGMKIGEAYAIWSGIGTAGIAIVGLVIFHEPLNAWSIVGIVLIVAGVLVINLLGGVSHA